MTAESGNPATGSTNQYQEEIIAHWNGRSREYDSRPHHGLQSQAIKAFLASPAGQGVHLDVSLAPSLRSLFISAEGEGEQREVG
jgi:hypothetical protein